MSYVVHGATGAQGAPVAAAIAAAGKPVTALARSADAAVPGARVLACDISSASALAEAYRGAEGVFVHLPLGSHQDRLGWARNIVAAVREARPARVVFSTSGGMVDHSDSPPEASAAVAIVAKGLADSGVSYAVIEPRLFLDNLLMPHVVDAVRKQGVLYYPLRADFAVSWISHLGMADVALALFARPDVTGIVPAGQYPGITGSDLAADFGAHFGRAVAYEPLTPDQFRAAVAPLIGEDAASDIAGYYAWLGQLPDLAIPPERSAQTLLGLVPRTTAQWLADMGIGR